MSSRSSDLLFKLLRSGPGEVVGRPSHRLASRCLVLSLAGFSSVAAAPSRKGVWENNYQVFFPFRLASRRKRIPAPVKLRADLKSGRGAAGRGNRKGLPPSACPEMGRGRGALELGGGGRTCQHTRRKTDVLRRDDAAFKMQLHGKLRGWEGGSRGS